MWSPSVVAAQLMAASDLPAEGHRERAAWVTRGLAEILAMGATFPSRQLVSAVDHAVRSLRLEGAGERFGDRLRELRRWHGKVPATYESVGKCEAQSLSPIADRDVIAAAVAVARFADALHAHCKTAGGKETLTKTSRREAMQVLRETADLRPGGKKTAKVLSSPLPGRLVWRMWMAHPEDGSPLYLAASDTWHGTLQRRCWIGFHNGCHMDAIEAARSVSPLAPLRLQYGEGLLLAESIAMAGEFIVADLAAHEGRLQLVRVLYDGFVERIARLPGVRSWLPPLIPDSATCAAVVAAPVQKEFVFLPTLTSAYIRGPLHLAERRFEHDLLTLEYSGAVASAWSAALTRGGPLAVLKEALGGSA